MQGRVTTSKNMNQNQTAPSCRSDCGACCTAPSITSPIPGMPNGKPAGVRCIQLADDNRCRIFGQPERPAFCAGLQPSQEMCGTTRKQAMLWLDCWRRPKTDPAVGVVPTEN